LRELWARAPTHVTPAFSQGKCHADSQQPTKQLSRSTLTKPSLPEEAKSSPPFERMSPVKASNGATDQDRLAGTLPEKLMLMIEAPWLMA
jgi:hypothetical protein